MQQNHLRSRSGTSTSFASNPRRTRGRLKSRSTLALSLMLVAGAVAVPVFADDSAGLPAITSPTEGEVIYLSELTLEANVIEGEDPRWSVRELSQEDGPECFAPEEDRTDRAGHHVRGQTDDYEVDNGNFKASVDIADWDAGEYCLSINQGDPALDSQERDYVFFEINDSLRDFDDDEIAVCKADEECELNTENFTANIAGQSNTAFGLRSRNDEISKAVSDACESLVEDSVRRLGDDVAHIVPVGFEGGEITVESKIPSDVVYGAVGEARGEGIFDVCVAPEKDEGEEAVNYAGYEDLEEISGADGFYGPVLLENCRGGPFAKDACVESREKNEDGDVVLTYRIPTEDPMLR